MTALGRKRTFASVCYRPIADIGERLDRLVSLRGSSPDRLPDQGKSGNSWRASVTLHRELKRDAPLLVHANTNAPAYALPLGLLESDPSTHCDADKREDDIDSSTHKRCRNVMDAELPFSN